MSAGSSTDSWIQRYLVAWESNRPDDIGDLFSDNATYYTAPYRAGWQGRQAIIDGWLGRKDDSGTWHFEYEVLAEQHGLGVVQAITTYASLGRRYSNLWLIWPNPESRCYKFVEYFMPHQDDGS